MAKLLVQEGASIREIELLELETTIGRGKANLLRLVHPSISNRHCVIRRTPAGYEVEDLGSSNGVLFNGKRVAAASLRPGDRMDLGEIRLTFQDTLPEDPARTVAIQAGAPEAPRVTVRMRAEDLAEFHGQQTFTPPPAATAPFALDAELVATLIAGLGVGADLHGVCLAGAKLVRVNLERADLSAADLRGANLREANLSGATLKGADLQGANLRGANLERANLRLANLKGATLFGTNLEGANLEGSLQ